MDGWELTQSQELFLACAVLAGLGVRLWFRHLWWFGVGLMATGAVCVGAAWYTLDTSPPERAWQLVAAGVVIVGTALAPRHRRFLIGVPLVLVTVALVVLVGIGRSTLESERRIAEESAASAKVDSYEAKCLLAERYVDLELLDAARRALERAASSAPEGADHSVCTATAAAAAAAAQPAAVQIYTESGDATSSDRVVTFVDAFEAGVEELFEPVLRAAVAGDDAIELGQPGWLALGVAAFALLVAWTRLYGWIERQVSSASVTLADPIVACSTWKDRGPAFAADLRVELRALDVEGGGGQPALVNELAGVVSESGAAGAKWIAAALQAGGRLFGASHSVTASVTLVDTSAAVLRVTEDRNGRERHIERLDGGETPLARVVATRIRVQTVSRLGATALPGWQAFPLEAMRESARAEAAQRKYDELERRLRP